MALSNRSSSSASNPAIITSSYLRREAAECGYWLQVVCANGIGDTGWPDWPGVLSSPAW